MPGAAYFQNVMTLRDAGFEGRRVFVRVDFNVPVGKSGEVEDDFRIRSSLPTIEYLLSHGGVPVLASHLGRPKGRPSQEFTLRPVVSVLERLLGKKVRFAPDCVGEETSRMVRAVAPGEVLLLENLRFHAEEEANEPVFSRALASLADLYVNDAFGTSHRAHASTVGVPRILKPALAGLLMEKEIAFLGRLLSGPERPFIAILGGAKVSDKIEVIQNLLSRVDGLLIGGGMANTFLRARGFDIGSSLFEEKSVCIAGQIMDSAASTNVPFLLPADYVAASKIAAGAATVLLDRGTEVPRGFSLVDVGGKTIADFCDRISSAKTIFWNGPLGVFEIEDFSRGTREIARAVAAASGKGAVSVIGGGDTASAIDKAGVASEITHVSTGGGASLEFVGGIELPGIAALSKKE
jgi:phosphoglycerate kinase